VEDNQKVSIRQLSEWNKWLVSIEIAGIAALGFLVKEQQSLVVGVFGLLTIVTFFISIVISSFFLLNLSYVISESEVKPGQRLTNVKVPFRAFIQKQKWPFFSQKHYRIGQFTTWISRLFLIGIILFSATFAMQFIAKIAAALHFC
jgi:hypothetical protein